jgi:hypothetical protein
MALPVTRPSRPNVLFDGGWRTVMRPPHAIRAPTDDLPPQEQAPTCEGRPHASASSQSVVGQRGSRAMTCVACLSRRARAPLQRHPMDALLLHHLGETYVTGSALGLSSHLLSSTSRHPFCALNQHTCSRSTNLFCICASILGMLARSYFVYLPTLCTSSTAAPSGFPSPDSGR